jgi:hypothetical protein
MKAHLGLPTMLRITFARLLRVLAVSALVTGPSALAQRVSFGVVAGGYANKDFISHYIPIPGFLPSIAVSDAGGYLIGLTAEVPVHRNFSFAADALYKPLHYKMSASFYPDRSIGYAPATVVTWQFPLLVRYHFSTGTTRPFLEGGASLRTAGNLNQTNPSNHGFSAGLGLETKWGATSFAPNVRYTRWAKDRYPWSHDVQTRPDQLEFMIRFSWGLGRK